MDFHFNKRQFEDGRLDFHRFVLLITHRFSDRIRFVSELELEHALVEGLEDAGELELEQAYVDFLLSRKFNVRAGMMLVLGEWMLRFFGPDRRDFYPDRRFCANRKQLAARRSRARRCFRAEPPATR